MSLMVLEWEQELGFLNICIQWFGQWLGWNSRFQRSSNDGEIEQVFNFFASIQEKRLCLERKDTLVWNLSKEGIFIVKSLYGVLLGSGEAVPYKNELELNHLKNG